MISYLCLCVLWFVGLVLHTEAYVSYMGCSRSVLPEAGAALMLCRDSCASKNARPVTCESPRYQKRESPCVTILQTIILEVIVFHLY